MSGGSTTNERASIGIGAVTYLNARPLTCHLSELAPAARIEMDVPSRLADGLADGRFDVALIPSIEYLRRPGYTIVSDACVACDGPVRSVKLYSRVPIPDVRTLAVDEGSRTSAAMVRILLRERFAVEPAIAPLPIGATLEESTADAVLLIGDRAIRPPDGAFSVVWDLGEEWSRWTGLPFVFAMWVGRGDLDWNGWAGLFAAARDKGVGRLDEIAREEAPLAGISEEECRSYLRDNLRFHLGERERAGFETFCRLAGRHQLAPTGVPLVFEHHESA